MSEKSENTQEEHALIAQRREKLQALREEGVAFPNNFRRNVMAGELHAKYGDKEKEWLEENPVRVAVAGRMMTRRIMGKASFAHLKDMSGRIQLYVQRDALPEGLYNQQFKKWDLGDIIGAEGELFKTKTGELSIKVDSIQLLTKSLRPLPEKWHGLSDQETRYRQRYLDLIINDVTGETFQTRSKIIHHMREFMVHHGFLEVETPMMQAIPGGATARPFTTYHNALDMELYLRIAPELYLKRLVVGGFEKVFEINRNFRNEGLSTRHNPEFTMIEIYQAYADYNVMMDLTEELVWLCVERQCGKSKVEFGDLEIDFTRPWRRAAYADLLAEHAGCDIEDMASVREKAKKLDIDESEMDDAVVINEVFEATVEENLIAPTFVIDYPAALCPLARRKADNPNLAARFELLVAGMELANAYTELNDPAQQYENFLHQLRGEEESLTKMDNDYITALKYGMPPAGGLGIGIDRLIMVLTNAPTLRDVVLFPLLRSAKNSGATPTQKM